MQTTHLWQAFKDGFQFEDAKLGAVTLHRQEAGELVVSTGQLVACDPLVFPETEPFHVTIAPGRYPVLASVAAFAQHGDRRIAYAFVQVSEREPVRWELARLTRQDLATLSEDEVYAYPVDAGTACFMDIDAATGLRRKLDSERSYVESLISEFGTHEYVNVTLNPFTGANVIMFASGWGDGCYASYWGYDNENQVSCLLTDFNLFAHPALVIAGRSQWRGWLPTKWFSRRKR